MVATAAPKIARHAAPADWTKRQRADLEKRLAAVGTTITELSDARELVGHPRLSEASAEDRELAHENVNAPEIRKALEQVRECRAWLVKQLGTLDEAVVRRARAELGLARNRTLRLGELSAVLGWSLEIAERTDGIGYTEEELFGG